jgi:hypothetical protein
MFVSAASYHISDTRPFALPCEDKIVRHFAFQQRRKFGLRIRVQYNLSRAGILCCSYQQVQFAAVDSAGLKDFAVRISGSRNDTE